METLKLKHHIQVKRSLGMGSVGAVFGADGVGPRTDARNARIQPVRGSGAGAARAVYRAGAAAAAPEGWLTKAALTKALSGMVITEQVLSQVGPAISSGNSMLVYGKPGDGKTYLIESLNNLDAVPSSCPTPSNARATSSSVFDPDLSPASRTKSLR